MSHRFANGSGPPTPGPTDSAQDAWAQRLALLLAPIDGGPHEWHPHLSHRLLAFILNGTDESVLNDLRQQPDVDSQMRLLNRFHGVDASEPDPYEGFDAVDVHMALRFARVIEAGAPTRSVLFIDLPEDLRWPELMLLHAAGAETSGLLSDDPKPAPLSAARIETMLAAAGREPGSLLVAAFSTTIPFDRTTRPRLVEQRMAMVGAMGGHADSLARHIQSLRPWLTPTSAALRRHVVQMLQSASSSTLRQVPEAVCALAVSDDKVVRVCAETLLRRIPEAVVTPLRQLVAGGRPAERQRARRLLQQAAGPTPNLPALPVIDWSPAANGIEPSWLDGFWRQVNERLVEHNRQVLEQSEQTNRRLRMHQLPLFEADEQEALRTHLEKDTRCSPPRQLDTSITWLHVAPALEALVGPCISPVALLRVLLFFHLAGRHGMLDYPAVRAFNALHLQTGRPTLLELAVMMESTGLSAEGLLRNLCNTWEVAIGEGWGAEAMQPYLMHHAEAIAQMLVKQSTDPASAFLPGLFRAIDAMPDLPDAVLNALFELAWGTARRSRDPAQAALARHPAASARVVDALTDPGAATRAQAADWLGRLGDRTAAPALQAALATEKQAAARSAMEAALHALG
ncbi:hypothetical protein ACLIJR_09115 [Hydrogenophaga sp. XSHU_21]